MEDYAGTLLQRNVATALPLSEVFVRALARQPDGYSELLLSGLHPYLCGICGSLPLCELEQRLCETNGWVREGEVLHLFARLAQPLTRKARSLMPNPGSSASAARKSRRSRKSKWQFAAAEASAVRCPPSRSAISPNTSLGLINRKTSSRPFSEGRLILTSPDNTANSPRPASPYGRWLVREHRLPPGRVANRSSIPGDAS